MSDQKFDLDQVRAVIKIASEAADVAELEVESPTLKVSVKKVQGAVRAAVTHVTPPAGAPAAYPPQTAAPGQRSVEAGGTDHLIPVTAPMVGTFYRSSNPDAPPFVSEGDAVDSGQTVCIIEAMKLFNEIQTDVTGRVARILVDNASPVEYGQPLMLIDTTAAGA